MGNNVAFFRLPEGFTQLLSLTQLYLNDAFLEFLPASFGRSGDFPDWIRMRLFFRIFIVVSVLTWSRKKTLKININSSINMQVSE